MDNVTCFAAGMVLGFLGAAIIGIFREAKHLDKMDTEWLARERMRQEDNRGRL